MATRQKTRKVPVALPEESAPGHWLRTLHLSGFTLIVLLLVILAVVVLAPSLHILIEQRQAIAQLEQELAQSQDAVDDLERDVARWSDPAYIEAQARERLYLVYPGELMYFVVDDVGASSSPDGVPISDEIQAARVDWVRGLLSSVFTAGLTEAPPGELVTPGVEGG